MERLSFKYESASADVNVDQSARVAVIFNFHSDTQGLGHGSMLMQQLVDYFDKQGYDAYLTAKPYGTHKMTLRVLIRFYERFGFIPTGASRRQRSMYRLSQNLQGL